MRTSASHSRDRSAAMSTPRYVMFEQARDKVPGIMREHRPAAMVTRPSWIALGLLVVAFNIIAASST